MSNGSPSEDRPTNGVRAAARDKARRLRVTQKKRERRSRVLLRTGLAIGIAAVVAIVAVVIVTSIRPPHAGPANMVSDGVLIGQGLKAERSAALPAGAKPTPHPIDTTGQVVNIVAYVDYGCAYCGEFERTNDEQIGKLVSSGAATLEVHPLPYYANSSASTTQYSLRAANAAACVANYAPDRFYEFNRLLFAHQPKTGGAGLSDARLAGYAGQAKATPLRDIRRCIEQRTYADWAQDALRRATTGPLPNADVKKVKTLPLVFVDGQEYKGSLTDASDFRTFIVQAQGEQVSTPQPTSSAGGGTPTPSSSPTPTSIIVSSTPTPSS
ncbi:DsbA family protein [Gryllotalpicola ginsengisoli]|uniref:DsbA family protein n=1 Tax=Gryllotalpicola ginsengisoli TaxID=444608 RepID=UPI0003B5E925|nr:thioredoxin domain-containing protein [Gryllotalpicola ginsengisoli]